MSTIITILGTDNPAASRTDINDNFAALNADKVETTGTTPVVITVPDETNLAGLTVTQNDTTNNPYGVRINNAGTNNALSINQTGDGTGLTIETDSTSFYGAFITTTADRTGTGRNLLRVEDKGAGTTETTAKFIQNGVGAALHLDKDVTNTNNTSGVQTIDHSSLVNDAGTYTKTGAALQINSNVTETSGTITDSAQVLDINQTHADATGNVVDIANDGTGNGLFLDQNGNGKALEIDSEATTEPSILVTAIATSSDVVRVDSTGIHTGTGSSSVVQIDQEHASSTGDVVNIDNDGTGRALFIDQNGDARAVVIDTEATTNPAIDIQIVDGDAHLRLTGDSGNATPTEGDLWRESDGLKYYDGTTEHNLIAALENISEDTTPTLGGELDAGANSIGFTMQTATGDGTTTVDWGAGNHMDFTFGAFNEVFTFTAPAKPGVYTMSLKQDSVGSREATWPATVKWPGGTKPAHTDTATTGYDVVSFRYDGTNFYGVASLDFS